MLREDRAVQAPCLSFLVRQAWLTTRATIQIALDEHHLSLAQYATLMVLEERPGISIADLARHETITRQSANELVGGMVDAGLVQRRQHPTDGRTQQLLLTDGGLARLNAARPAVQARELLLEEGLTDQQRNAARDWLNHVSEVTPGYA